MPLQTADFKPLLESARTIAVIGCSDQPHRTSYAISQYLIQRGYEVIPVNPNHDEVHGLTCYPDLKSIPEDVSIDIANIFRNPRYTADMVQMVADYAAAKQEQPAIWTQLGVSTPEATRLAEEAGLPYVHNRCIMVEHARLIE